MEELLDTYLLARKNKRRSSDSVKFELHYERELMRIDRELSDHTFNPSAYTFMAHRPRPREVFASEMSLRIIDHHLDLKMRPLIEARMVDRTFNNRIGYGGIAAINTLISDIYDVSEGFTKDAWVIKWDLAGYFPNADKNVAYSQLSEVLESDYDGPDKDDLRYMLMRSVFFEATNDCERISPLIEWEDYPKSKSLYSKPPGIGGEIGRLIWQNAMNYYLNDFDHFMIDQCGLHYVRFVDDMVIVTDNKESALAMMPIIRKRLSTLGCTLHPKKFYCQHYSKGVEFLGAYIKRDRVYASNRTVRNAFASVIRFNRMVRASKLEAFLASMNSYLGILKGRNAHNIVLRLIAHINPKWWKYCHFNAERVCLQANPGYTHKELLCRKYGLKFKTKERNGNKNQNREARGRKAGSGSKDGSV